MTILHKALLVGLLVILGACSSAPIRYHTLVPKQSASGVAMDIRDDQATVPPQVDRSQIVVRQGDTGLAILETEWWGASLADELQNALVDQLGSTPAASAQASLRVDVQRFDSVPGQFSLLDARWRLKPAGAGAITACRTTLQTPAGNSVDELVAAHQVNLRKLAEIIGQASRGQLTVCPTASVN